MSEHIPVAMILGESFARKHTYGTGRRGNIWYYSYRCPICGDRTSRPRNPFKGRKVPNPVCDGITYHPITGRPRKRPAKLPELGEQQ